MKNLVFRFLNDESGAAAIEYALIAGLIALAIVTGAGLLGQALGTKFTNISTSNGIAP
jgi:pilus assembly protein Flp/PilA